MGSYEQVLESSLDEIQEKYKDMLKCAWKRLKFLVFIFLLILIGSIIAFFLDLNYTFISLTWALNWALLFLPLLWISPLVFSGGQIPMASSSKLQKIFRALFDCLLIYCLALTAHLIYTTWLEVIVSYKAVIELSLAVVLTLISKLCVNELRFIRRLFFNDNSEKELGSSPYQRWTFSFVDDLIGIGLNKALEQDDLDALISGDTCIKVLHHFESIKDSSYSLAWNLYRLVWKEFFWQQCAALVGIVTIPAGPMLLKLTLDYLANPASVSHPSVPYFYGIALFVVTMSKSLSDGQVYFLGRRMGLRVKLTLISLIYQKSLKRFAKSELDNADSSSPGKLVTLMSVDGL